MSPAPPLVRNFERADRDRWNAFVNCNPKATFFHLAEWKEVLEKAFRHRAHYLLAESGGEVQGILPLGQIKSLLFGNSLISTPFCVYGGIVATNEAAHQALIDAACTLAQRLGVDHLEMRNLERVHPSWPCKDLYVTFRKNIDPDPEMNLKAIPRKQRAMVRKGIKSGLMSETDSSVKRFVPLYAESVRNLGTPVFPRRFFEVLKEKFGDRCEIMTVIKDDRPITSLMSFYFRDEVLPYYGGGGRKARELAANDFMYWELMRRAAERGVRVFDYGRSKRGAGSYRFKKHWGFEPQPLYYEYFLVNGHAPPNLSPSNPRYRLFIELWKRLPLWVHRRIGPLIAKNLG